MLGIENKAVVWCVFIFNLPRFRRSNASWGVGGWGDVQYVTSVRVTAGKNNHQTQMDTRFLGLLK